MTAPEYLAGCAVIGFVSAAANHAIPWAANSWRLWRERRWYRRLERRAHAGIAAHFGRVNKKRSEGGGQ